MWRLKWGISVEDDVDIFCEDKARDVCGGWGGEYCS